MKSSEQYWKQRNDELFEIYEKETFNVNKGLFQKETKIDISRYIEDGSNVIIYNPAVCPLKMYVELVEAYEKNQCFEKEILDDND